MVLESTIICVDNSEFMRNGDFLPTRIQAQQVRTFLSLLIIANNFLIPDSLTILQINTVFKGVKKIKAELQ